MKSASTPLPTESMPLAQRYPWLAPQWARWQQAQAHNMGHAYLLVGVQGLGLVEFAQHMAQSVLCSASVEIAQRPCGQCRTCHLFQQHNHPDWFHLQPDEGKKEVGVDQVRQLTQNLMQSAHQGGFKVALVNPVERLNISAFNALLKTLEEPPQGTLLILVTHQLDQLPATLVSRCQHIDFVSPPHQAGVEWLQAQRPELDLSYIKRSLRMNWGAPLSALAWLDAQAWQQDAQWHEDLHALSQGTKSLNQISATWLKWPEPRDIFRAFYLLSVTQIRRQAYAQQGAEHDGRWFHFQQQVLQAQQDWHHNANKELVIENLCLLYLKMAQGSASLDQVFMGEWIRGDWA